MQENTLLLYGAYVLKAGDVNLNGANIQEKIITLASYPSLGQDLIYLHPYYDPSSDEVSFIGNGRYTTLILISIKLVVKK